MRHVSQGTPAVVLAVQLLPLPLKEVALRAVGVHHRALQATQNSAACQETCGGWTTRIVHIHRCCGTQLIYTELQCICRRRPALLHPEACCRTSTACRR